jgi:predicted oxidoreductase
LTPAQGTEFLGELATDININPYQNNNPYLKSDLTRHPLIALRDAAKFGAEKFSPYQNYVMQSDQLVPSKILQNQLEIRHYSSEAQKQFFQLLFERSAVNEKAYRLLKEGNVKEAIETKRRWLEELNEASQKMKNANEK